MRHNLQGGHANDKNIGLVLGALGVFLLLFVSNMLPAGSSSWIKQMISITGVLVSLIGGYFSLRYYWYNDRQQFVNRVSWVGAILLVLLAYIFFFRPVLPVN